MDSELKDLARNPPVEPDARPLLKAEAETPRPQVNLTMEEMEKKYAAFVRKDVYGPMGLGELPWAEKFLLGVGLMFLLPLRVAAAMTLLVLYYMICRVCTAFLAPNIEGDQEDFAHMGGLRRTIILQSGRYLSRVVLVLFGFYSVSDTNLAVEEEELDDHLNSEVPDLIQMPHAFQAADKEVENPGAIVSNHVSYIDILYHMYFSFPSFVSKRSVAKIPLLGLVSKCLGCVYVQRELKSSDFKGVSCVITERVREAHKNKFAPKMMLFPEGTTTNGEYLLPFKTGAFLAKAPVRPVILRYPYQRFSPAWDSISGVRHVILLLCQFVNYIEVVKLPVYYPSEQEKENPKLYAENVRQLMAHEGNLMLSDIGLAEKRVYHAALNGNISMPTVLHHKDE